MPAALHQETAVGVLICAKQAVLEKCIATNGEVNFQRSVYEFGKDSLVAGMENLLKDIYCNFVQWMWRMPINPQHTSSWQISISLFNKECA